MHHVLPNQTIYISTYHKTISPYKLTLYNLISKNHTFTR